VFYRALDFLPQTSLGELSDPPTHISQVGSWDYAHAIPHSAYFFEVGAHFLPELDSNCDPPVSAVQVAGIRGLSHHTQP
jgi:hypothetical protein